MYRTLFFPVTFQSAMQVARHVKTVSDVSTCLATTRNRHYSQIANGPHDRNVSWNPWRHCRGQWSDCSDSPCKTRTLTNAGVQHNCSQFVRSTDPAEKQGCVPFVPSAATATGRERSHTQHIKQNWTRKLAQLSFEDTSKDLDTNESAIWSTDCMILQLRNGQNCPTGQCRICRQGNYSHGYFMC